MDPAGSIRLLGASTEALLFGDTLRSLGLRADFVHFDANFRVKNTWVAGVHRAHD